MQLILAHENSDFDAVSSQMLAQKLFPDAEPLLAHRVNRNVSRFLNLYWDALGFRRAEDWHRQRVDRAILVDTHSLPNVRGIHRVKEVQVIDHHLLSPNESPLPDHWQAHIEATGATATILTERLQQAGIILSDVEATLALLGIYEDTGTLTYDATTPRDINAAAWLLSIGARLSIVRRFLAIPLTADQQTLYTALLEESEWLTVEERTVLVAQATVSDDFTDEISTVAHRISRALVPDALLLAVQIEDNVQLVLRSATDHLNVGDMARQLGGGGHFKAAAALLPDQRLADVIPRLKFLVQELMAPQVTVRQIMSWGVQTVPAEMTMKAAAELILRSGHEGYPVEDEDGSLVGLLTRRAVDRAMAHELETLPVQQVMKSGTVTVAPEDSVRKVQRVMIASGWGQLPVVTKTGQILGIVTRTDLINFMFQPDLLEDSEGYQALLKELLPEATWAIVQRIGAVATEMGLPIYFVGGIVRDFLLRQEPKDIDFVVEGNAIALAEQLRERYGGRVRSHERFGTAKWLLAEDEGAEGKRPETFDFVSARTEFYEQPSALPEVKLGSIKLDLLRRDFTINALAIRLDGPYQGQLLDFYGGQRDLQNGLIRVLHSLSFIDDPTRIIRAVRLEQRLDFTIEPRTEELIGNALETIGRTTGSRIRHELDLILGAPQAAVILTRLDKLGVLAAFDKALTWDERLVGRFSQVDECLSDWLKPHGPDELTDVQLMRFQLWMLALSLDAQTHILQWLNVRRVTREEVRRSRQLWSELPHLEDEARPGEIAARLTPYRDYYRVLGVCYIEAESQGLTEAAQAIRRYWTEWRHIAAVLDGEALLALGVPRGPDVGFLLTELLARRLNGELVSEADERAFVRNWLASRS